MASTFGRISSALTAGALVLCVLGSASAAGEYHVDINNGSDSWSGTLAQPWRTLNYAMGQLSPGDTLYIHEGTYSQSNYTVPCSGTPGNWITIRNYQDDVVNINTTNSGFLIYDREYLIFDGLTLNTGGNNCFKAFTSWLIIRNCTMQSATYRSAGLAVKCNRSARDHHHLIENCLIRDFFDIPLFHDNMDSVIIRNNVLYDATYVLMDPGGVSNLLIEGNFTNQDQNRLGALKIRWGDDEPQSGDNCRGAIVRRNVFCNGERYGILLASANGAAVYHNTLCKIDGYMTESGILFMQQDGNDSGPDNNNNNAVKNNIFVCLSGDSSSYWQNTCVWMQESMDEDWGDQEFDYNWYYKPNGVEVVSYHTTRIHEDDINGWYYGQYDLHSTAGVDPQLVDPTVAAGIEGFRLQPTSPCIDAGGPLTTTVGAGSGTVVPVVDAKYFCTGLDLVDGDLIRIGDNPPVRVVLRDIDYNVLMVDGEVSWSDGDGVNLDYNGAGPDVGAFESEAAQVVGRHVFYNNSDWDGWDPAANAADDGAIAPDKQALLPGQTASFANFTNYTRGINGLMVDVDGLAGTPTAADFAFRVGNDETPGDWAVLSDPGISVSVRPGAGAGGSDRVTILLPDNLVEKQWLEVTALATVNTGLDADDVFYFGNMIADADGDGSVTPTDEVAVRNDAHTIAVDPAALGCACDFNRDRKVGPTEAVLVRHHATNSSTELNLITVP